MTGFERKYLLLEMFMPCLPVYARKNIKQIVSTLEGNVKLLDVGGRKSHYTIGIPASITISDLPQETDLQQQLNLGLTSNSMSELLHRRSNVKDVILDDMTNSGLPDEAFDFLVAIEVIEHVEEDEKFVQEIARVVKSNGIFFLTTPNGDHFPPTNPDHKRHYTKLQLETLLSKYFRQVEVYYAVRSGRFFLLSLRSWSVRRPIRTIVTMIASIVNRFQSASQSLKSDAQHTHHLVGWARYPLDN